MLKIPNPSIPSVLPLGLLVKLRESLCFTLKRGLAVWKGLNILRGKATILATTSYVQLSKNNLQDYFITRTRVCIHGKAIHPLPTHWTIALYIP
jgi:hypothetical protein